MKTVTKKDEKATNDVTKDEAKETGIPESIALFGKKVFDTAVTIATSALKSVAGTDVELRSLNAEILLKKEGNSAKLHKLAIKCVELTAEGKRARLKEAALLFRDSCKYVEQEFCAAYANANPGADARIQVLVPSWPTLRANFAGMMERATINPADHVKPTSAIEAYSAWKSNPDNAGDKDSRGRQPQARKVAGTAASLDINATPGAEQMSSHLKTAMATLIGTIQGLTTEQQDIAAEKIALLVLDLNALMGASGSTQTVKVPVQPALNG